MKRLNSKVENILSDDPVRIDKSGRSGKSTALRFALSASVLAALLAGACGSSTPQARVPSDWTSWRKPVDKILNYPIPGHGDKARVIYVNAPGWEYAGRAGSGRLEFPDGTVVVKEVYASANPAPGEKPTTLDVMIKASKDPEARGGWLWIVKDLGSDKETVMTNTFCQTCHANANSAHPYGDKNPGGAFRDYLYFPPMPGP